MSQNNNNFTQPYNVEQYFNGFNTAQEVETLRQQRRREQDNRAQDRTREKKENEQRESAEREGYHYLKQVTGYYGNPSEQFQTLMTDLKSITYNGFKCHTERFEPFRSTAASNDRNDCTLLVLPFLATKEQFDIIIDRRRLPSVKTIEQVLTCRIVPIQHDTNSFFKRKLEQFLNHKDQPQPLNGVFIGGILTKSKGTPISHMMLLIIAMVENEIVEMSIFDPQEIDIQDARLYGINHDSRVVILDRLFRNADTVTCTFFNTMAQIDLHSVIDELKPLSRSASSATRGFTPNPFNFTRRLSNTTPYRSGTRNGNSPRTGPVNKHGKRRGKKRNGPRNKTNRKP